MAIYQYLQHTYNLYVKHALKTVSIAKPQQNAKHAQSKPIFLPIPKQSQANYPHVYQSANHYKNTTYFSANVNPIPVKLLYSIQMVVLVINGNTKI